MTFFILGAEPVEGVTFFALHHDSTVIAVQLNVVGINLHDFVEERLYPPRLWAVFR